jgi:glycosyltransferase involved in cell wall biosynthesis
MLLPELARYYEIEVVTEQPVVEDAWIQANFPIRSVAWFKENHQRYERCLYQVGNSAFHQHMFELLQAFPGVITLHDFYLVNVKGHMDVTGYKAATLMQALYASHGYSALHLLVNEDYSDVMKSYPANKRALDSARGVVVHSHFPKQLAQQWYGDDYPEQWEVIPLVRAPKQHNSRAEARRQLGVGTDDIIICSFGMLAPSKQNQRLLNAWLASPLSHNVHCKLVFVGELGGREYTPVIQQIIRLAHAKERIQITGFASQEDYNNWLAAADVAVQLRTDTRGETSAAILDCLASGLPTIFNAYGSATEIPDGLAIKLSGEFADAELGAALEQVLGDDVLRQTLAEAGSAYLQQHHAPARVGVMYREAIEGFYQHDPRLQEDRLVQAIQGIRLNTLPSDQDFMQVAECMVANRQFAQGQKTLFVDLSNLVKRDYKTGVHRATQALLRELLFNPPVGYRVEPIYADGEQYRYARGLTCRLLGLDDLFLPDETVEFKRGDSFLGLDLVVHSMPQMEAILQLQRARGVKLYWVVYDLLPFLLPDCFDEEMVSHYQRWLSSVTQVADGLLGISGAVADELRQWCADYPPKRPDPLRIGHFQMGTDIKQHPSSTGLPANSAAILAALQQRPAVLMVGTVEPRKGYQQTLAAFEQLWGAGVDATFVMVGQVGWKMDELAAKIQSHPELGKRLFWLSDASDEMLLKLYEHSTVLLAAAEGEGFGLPLIEAAQHDLPIIARDLPVFREIAGEHAFYFQGKAPQALADAIQQWLSLWQAGSAPSSAGISWLTWAESAAQLKAFVIGQA